MIGRLWRGAGLVLSAFLIAGVRVYQACVRPLLPPLCRFQPSCSEYMILAVRKHGPVVGACKGCWRICRCGPWTRGGYDPP
jgi:putative membrane protein insertion efficiency factor